MYPVHIIHPPTLDALLHYAIRKITHFENFFSNCVYIGHINALWKKIEKEILHGSFKLSRFKILKIMIDFENKSISSNILIMILLIVRSFVKLLK